MAWWSGRVPDNVSDPIEGYAATLALIRDRLPPDLHATTESVSLHDTRLRELRVSVPEGVVTLELDSYSGDERFKLTYSGVERFESLADPAVGLGGPAGYGDLGYCEVAELPGGLLEHRLLFSTGIELVVTFRGFQLDRGKR